MSASVVHIGLDAAEPSVVEALASSGRMPNVARVIDRSTAIDVTPSPDLPGTLWPEFATGQIGARSGVYFPPAQIINGSSRQERMTSDYLDSDSWFWQVASRAGRSVASIDMVHAALTSCDAFEIVEWGSHDRMISPTGSSPEGALDELQRRFGEYPIHSCDTFHKGTKRGYGRLRDELLVGAQRKGRLASDVFARQHWDLASVVFTETHCACHQLWHLHDPQHRQRPRRLGDLAGSVADVYEAVDAAIGQVLDVVGADTRIVLTAVKGSSSAVGGPHLVSDVLAALDLIAPRSWKSRLWDEVPGFVKAQLSGIPLERRARLGIGREPGHAGVEGSARALRNDQTGAIRLHIAGRDPGGELGPDEAVTVLEQIEMAFRGLRHIPSGKPVVREVYRLFEVYGDAANPDLPDLAIEFDLSLGPIERVKGDAVGELRRPYRRVRTGDHTGNAAAWIVAPEVARSVDGQRRLCDVSASVLALCGVERPTKYDGTAEGIVEG